MSPIAKPSALGRLLADLIAIAAAILILATPAKIASQGTEDLGADKQLEEQRLTTGLQDRMRALYAQGRYNESIELANQILASDPENGIAFLFKNLAETRLLEGRTSPPVVSNLPTSAPRATPAPVVYTPPPVYVPKKRSMFSMDTLRDNPAVKIIAIILAVLVVVAAVLGFIAMRKPKEKTKATQDFPTQMEKTRGITDLPTSKSMLADLPTARTLADMPTSSEPMPTASDPPSRVKVTAAPARTRPTPPPPTPAPAPASALVSDDEIARPEMPAFIASTAPPIEAAPVVEQAPPEIGSSVRLDLSDSQVSDVEVTAHGMMDAPSAPPFSAGGTRMGQAKGMPLPPVAAAPPMGAPPIDFSFDPEDAPDTRPPSIAAPAPALGDTVAVGFAAAPPMLDASIDDPFAAPAPAVSAKPAPKAQAKAADIVDPEISFNSIMFDQGPPKLDAPSKGASAPPPDDMSKTSFNRQYDELMMGPGNEKTGVALDLGLGGRSPSGDDELTGGLTVSAPSSKNVPEGQQPIGDLDATAHIEPVTAKPAGAALGSASSSSMFNRQLDSGKAAFQAGDFAKAVQCLSVAATLRPTDMEVRQLLDEARKRRRG